MSKDKERVVLIEPHYFKAFMDASGLHQFGADANGVNQSKLPPAAPGSKHKPVI